MKYLVLLLIPISLIVNSLSAQEGSQVRENQPRLFEVDFVHERIRSNIEDEFVDFFKAKVSLGVLTPREELRCQLKLSNPSDSSLWLGNIRSSCNCGKFKVDKLSLDSGENAAGELVIRIPAATRNGDFIVVTELFNENGKPLGRIVFKGILEGMLAFENSSWQVPLTDESQTCLIPINRTPPTELISLVAEKTGFGDGVSFQIIEDKNQIFLKLDIESSQVCENASFRSGSFKVQDTESGNYSKVNVLMYEKAPVEISPTLLRFKTRKNGKRFATAMLEIENDQIKTTSELELKVDCCVNYRRLGEEVSQTLVCKTRKLTNGIYKLELSATDLPTVENVVVVWSVQTNSDQFEIRGTLTDGDELGDE